MLLADVGAQRLDDQVLVVAQGQDVLVAKLIALANEGKIAYSLYSL